MTTSRGRIAFAALAFGALLLVIGARPASALPSFAAAYGMKCSACHTVPPQLNSYGRYIQRTGYGALQRDVLKNGTPVNIGEEATYDSQSPTDPHRIVAGNLAVHVAGYVAPDVTYHIHQWIVNNNQPGGLDTFQIAYNHLFNGNGHLFAGKLSALPVPGPFSNQADIAPYASANLVVGEHMYTDGMMRWGGAVSYVHSSFFAEAGWLGSAADLGGAGDFTNGTDKTFQWIAAYADPNKPWEIGAYGSIGSFPLADGGSDHYNATGLYVQRDPGPHLMPGILALYKWGHDDNPGMSMMGAGPPMPLGPANSTAETFELWEPVFADRGILALRQESTNDGLGNVVQSGNIDLQLAPFRHYDYFHLYLESALTQNSTPAWRAGAWWIFPLKL